MIRARDLIERVFWSFVSGFLGSFLGAPLVLQVIEGVADVEISVDALQAIVISSAFAGLTAAANVATVIARWRLAVLPNPGDGLPGLPTNDTGTTLPAVAAILLAIVTAAAVTDGLTPWALLPAGALALALIAPHPGPSGHHRT